MLTTKIDYMTLVDMSTIYASTKRQTPASCRSPPGRFVFWPARYAASVTTTIAAMIRWHARSLAAHVHPGETSARPRPLKIETADAAVDVEDLAAEREPFAPSRAHRSEIDLIERHAACRHFREVESTIAHDRQIELDEIADGATAFFLRELRENERWEEPLG